MVSESIKSSSCEAQEDQNNAAGFEHKFQRQMLQKGKKHQNVFDAMFYSINKIKESQQTNSVKINKQIESVELYANQLNDNLDTFKVELKDHEKYNQKLLVEIKAIDQQTQYFQSQTKHQMDEFNKQILKEMDQTRKLVANAQLSLAQQLTINHELKLTQSNIDEKQ